MSNKYVLAIDQGTTSSRAILFSADCKPVGMAQKEFTQYFPADGWVEHDPEEIWSSTKSVCTAVLEKNSVLSHEIEAIGITNQRETTIIWDKTTGRPVYNAIVWQDRRTAEICDNLRADGHEQWISERTGLVLDPYFSASKIQWILDNVEGARKKAELGHLLFGTIDSFLLWRLTGGGSHKTDATNASRTMLFNIHSQSWDSDLLSLLRIPESMLPSVEDCSSEFGYSERSIFGDSIPILGVAGDQHAALIGQCCFESGMIKSTFGTGCFVMLNTGDHPVRSKNKLLTTVAYRLNGQTTYGLEGSIFVAGAAIQWLRDKVKLISSAEESEQIARRVEGNSGLYLVPAFTGLGAPYWDPNARGALLGLTRDTTGDDIVRATLESVSYQCRDLLESMTLDGAPISRLLVDGGMVTNDWLAQNLADILQLSVDRPKISETTALGAAYLASLGANLVSGLDEISNKWEIDEQFSPLIKSSEADDLYKGWQHSVKRTLSI
ncbi:MAG: glycerol kinase [Gammaproteobacteria bacterium]|nr:glycerol kinase [Gammaproteobacteria bacterium]